jgi:hypothetical protein
MDRERDMKPTRWIPRRTRQSRQDGLTGCGGRGNDTDKVDPVYYQDLNSRGQRTVDIIIEALYRQLCAIIILSCPKSQENLE